jgi:hypothetical protein
LLASPAPASSQWGPLCDCAVCLAAIFEMELQSDGEGAS